MRICWTEALISARKLTLFRRVEIEESLLPREHSIQTFHRLHIIEIVDDGVRHDALLQVDASDVIVGANHQDPAFFRCSEELQQVG